MFGKKKEEPIKRYCTVEESLIQSFKEVKLIRAGLMKAKTWDEFEKDMREYIERVKNGEED